jgi:hypothetical protein
MDSLADQSLNDMDAIQEWNEPTQYHGRKLCISQLKTQRDLTEYDNKHTDSQNDDKHTLIPEIESETRSHRKTKQPIVSISRRPGPASDIANQRYSTFVKNDFRKYESSQPELHPWQSSFWRRRPIIAWIILIFAVLSTMASIITLRSSHDQHANWAITPSVQIAFFAQLTPMLLTFALNDGVTMHWWYTAMQSSTSIQDLHDIWASGMDLSQVLLRPLAFNVVGLASFAVFMASVSIGPLLQQASSVSSVMRSSSVLILFSAAQQFPFGYTGILSTGASEDGTNLNVSTNLSSPSAITGLLTNDFSNIVRQYDRGQAANITLIAFDSGLRTEGLASNLAASDFLGSLVDTPYSPLILSYDSPITGILQSAGYSIDCTSYSNSLNMTQQWNETQISTTTFTNTLFSTEFNYSLTDEQNGDAQIRYYSVLKTVSSCSSDLEIQNCTLYPALLQQHVIIVNNTISLDPAYTYQSDQVVHPISTPRSFNQSSTHGGMALLLASRFNSNATSIISFDESINSTVQQFQSTGVVALENMNANSIVSWTYLDCSHYWADPTADIMATARDLAFRVSIAAGYGDTDPDDIQQLSNATIHRTIPVYKSQYKFWAGALVFAILPTLVLIRILEHSIGLGRNISMSPIETAKAFGAPFLDGVDSNATIKQILKEVGRKKIQYGVLESTDAGDKGHDYKKLVMDDPHSVRKPRDYETFDST